MAGDVVHREIVQFMVMDKGSEKVDKMSVAVDTYKGKKHALTLTEERHRSATKKSIVVTDMYTMSNATLMKTVHMLNMSVLGINMSLLGLSWNLSRTGMFSDEMVTKITNVIAPIQMVASVVNLASASYQFYNIISRVLATTHLITSAKVAAGNLAMASSFMRLRLAIFGTIFAMGAAAAIMGVFLAKGPLVKGILGAIGGAMLALAAKSWIAAFANNAFQVSLGPIGWAIVIGGLAVLGTVLGALMGFMKMGGGLFKGGIVPGRTTATLGELGPEAVIPISGHTGRQTLRGMGGGTAGMAVQQMNVYVRADRPATLFRGMNKSVRRQTFLQASI